MTRSSLTCFFYYIKLQYPIVCLSVCTLPLSDTTVGQHPNMAHIYSDRYGKEGGREGGRDGGREGGRQGGRQGREGGRDAGREGGRDGTPAKPGNQLV